MDVSRAATARRLAEDLSRLSAVAAELADAVVFELTRDAKAKDVARALGVSEPSVRKAVRQHNARRNVR